MHRWRTISVVVGLALLITLVLAVTDSARAGSHAGLSSLGFGRPFDWLVQDQSRLDLPAYPVDQGFGSPQEMPTTYAGWALLADLSLVLVTVAALWWGAAGVRRRLRPIRA